MAYKMELELVLRDFTAQFVSLEQYQQLMFILGQRANSLAGNHQCYKKVLTLFNKFHTNSIENFEDMLDQLQFPFFYNRNKSLEENRHDF